MTNQKKFEEVFGFPYSHLKELPEVWLFEEYKKYRCYKVTFYDRFFNEVRIKKTLSVYAESKKAAREKAICELGREYRRFSSGRPEYFLKIEREEDK